MHCGVTTKRDVGEVWVWILLSTQDATLTWDWPKLTIGHTEGSDWLYMSGVMYTCDCKVLIGSHPNPALESAWWDSQLSGTNFGAESWFQHLQSWGQPFSLTFVDTAFDLLATISIQNQFVSLILWIYIGVRTISNAKIYSHPSLSYSEVVYPPVPRNCRVKPVNKKYSSHLNLCFALYWLEQFLWFLVMAGTNNLADIKT